MARPLLDGLVRNSAELVRRLTCAEVDIKRLWAIVNRRGGDPVSITAVNSGGDSQTDRTPSYHGTLNGALASGGYQTLNIDGGGTATVWLYLPGSVSSGKKVHAVLDADGKYYVIAADCS